MSWESNRASEEICSFVGSELLNGEAVAPSDDLLGSGRVDSLGVMRLIAFVEERFGFRVPAADVTIENFSNVETIVVYLGRLQEPAMSKPEA